MVIFLLAFFFFNVPSTPVIYTLSLHDALPISACGEQPGAHRQRQHRGTDQGRTQRVPQQGEPLRRVDRKSTRLNSSHVAISYAVFCLKKKKTNKNKTLTTSKLKQSKHYTLLTY